MHIKIYKLFEECNISMSRFVIVIQPPHIQCSGYQPPFGNNAQCYFYAHF